MTQIFADGFESGDFTAWTSTTGTPTVVAGGHHGSKEANFDANGEYATKTYAGTRTVYTRVYVKFSTLPDGNGDYCYVVHNAVIGVANIHRFGLIMTGGVVYWYMSYRSAGGYLTATSAEQSAPSINTWYCVEIRTTMSTADGQLNGEYHAYVDGVELSDIAKTGIDTDQTGITGTRVGFDVLGGFASTLSADCVVVADAYIGPEGAGGPTIKKGGALPNIMSQLLNNGTFFSASKRFPKFTPRVVI